MADLGTRFRKKSLDELSRLSPEAYRQSEKLNLSVLLDNVRSAHNVGSIFRTADCLGLHSLYLCGITAQPPHREINKTAIGATNTVAWEYCKDAVSLATDLKARGVRLMALEQTHHSISMDELDFSKMNEQHAVLIIGNEVDGVSQELIDLCQESLEIPQYGTKHSFNVSVAAGISLYHISSQLRSKK